MRIWIPLRCVAIVLALGAGMLGLTATDAFAVAGKPVTVNVGQEMANATLVFDMKEGPDVEVVVSPQGEATLPANVNKDTVADCYKKEKTATGETKEKVNCAAWLPAGGAGWPAGTRRRAPCALAQARRLDVDLARRDDAMQAVIVSRLRKHGGHGNAQG